MKTFNTVLIMILAIAFAGLTSSAQTSRVQPKLYVQTPHTRMIEALAFSPHNTFLASAAEDTTVRLWEVATGKELQTYYGEKYCKSFAFSPDEKQLVSQCNYFKLREVRTGREILSFPVDVFRATSVAFLQDGAVLVAGGFDEKHVWARTFDTITGQELTKLTAPLEPGEWFFKSVFSRDFKSVAIRTSNDGFRKIDLTTAKVTFSPDTGPGHERVLSPDLKTLAESTGGVIKLKDFLSGKELLTLTHPQEVKQMEFSPDGKILVTTHAPAPIWDLKNPICLWDVTTGKEIHTLKEQNNYATPGPLTFSGDGKYFTGNWDNYKDKYYAIKLIDIVSRKEFELAGHPKTIDYRAFSPDGKFLASGDRRGGIKLWDLATRQEFRPFAQGAASALSSPIGTMAFDPYSGLAANTNRLFATGRGDGSLKLWNLGTGQLQRTIHAHNAGVISVGFGFSKDTLISTGYDKASRVWNLVTGELLDTTYYRGMLYGMTVPDSPLPSPNGKVLARANLDGTITFKEAATQKELVRIVSINGDDWLVVAPDGLFDGSPGAFRQLNWRFSEDIFDSSPVEAFFNEFYYPGLLADIFSEKRPKAPSDISQKDRRQPELKLALANAGIGTTVATRALKVNVNVSEAVADKYHKTGSGVRDVRLFRNGSLVKVWRGDVLKGKSSVTLETTIPIVAGENKLTAYAFNQDNIKSSDATLVINGADSLKRPGTAYIFAIGVNKYSNEQYNLNYAVPDAQDFAAEIKRQQEALKRYAQVEVISLADAQATKANITQKLTELSTRVQPEDAVIVFFAGHGTAHGNQFFLIPHDLGYAGSRENLSAAGLQTILKHSISDRELEKLFEGIDAGQLLLVIDACNSGQALEAEEKRRGPMNSKGLAQLAYEKGMYVMTAAQSYQAALEAAKFGHGFLTYALVEEGLKKGSADHEPKNGTIDIREWLNFATAEVPRMQEENSLEALRSRRRYVVFVGDGREVGVPKNESGARDNIQRPRVFYRRELETNPFVVAATGTTPPR